VVSVLITGANGFIGTHMAARLKGRGWRVVGSDLQACSHHPNCDLYLPLDLSKPAEGTAFRDIASIDYVLHAGGISGFMVEPNDPARIFSVNVAGSLPILELARTGRVRRLILCSSIMVYGPGRKSGGGELLEEDYPEPISVYGASKLALESLMNGYVGQFGLDAVALRLSHVYGPGRTTECFIREMITAALRGSPCTVAQASNSSRQYVYIEDVCDSVELAMDSSELPARVFNITGGERHTLGEVAEEIRRTIGQCAVTFDESRNPPNYQLEALSIDRAHNFLGYRPGFSLARGIAAYARELSDARSQGAAQAFELHRQRGHSD
jgi:nucleoside-diphosphate-sugar epimerase